MSGAPLLDVDTIEAGKRLVRVNAARAIPLSERISNALYRFSWRMPFSALRPRGRYPLKLVTVPEDPVRGDAERGLAMLGGSIRWRGETQDIATCTFDEEGWSPSFAAFMHSFAWLRDLGSLNDRETTAPVAEHLMRAWLTSHGETISEPVWQGDWAGRRVLFWTAYAPLILSSTDIVYRSSVLSALERTAGHLERSAPRMDLGAARIEAWAGIIAAGLLMPGGDARRVYGEVGLTKALATGLTAEGGTLCRSPDRLCDVLSLLALLQKCYDARRMEPLPAIRDALNKGVAALMGLTHGDGGLSSWQGSLPLNKPDVDAVVRGTSVRSRPLRQSRDWGYQRLQHGKTVVIVDGAPPPVGRYLATGCASTLAFELSDGGHRLIVNCGGASASGLGVPSALAQALRTTAAHSTLTLADCNSTAILADGVLGKGVTEVEADWQESESGSRIELSHDGYAKRFGLLHRRTLTLKADGLELRGDDVLLPAKGRKSQAADFSIRFHLGMGVEASPTADGNGALLRLPDGRLWQFRCQGGPLSIEGSVWIDGTGRMYATQQLVVNATAPAGGALVNWVLKRAG